MHQNSNLSRRNLFVFSGAALASTLMAPKNLLASSDATQDDQQDFWKYVPLDPQTVAGDAYRFYMENHCMYATFRGICHNVGKASQSKNPLLTRTLEMFPYQMMKYGRTGCGGSGTLCGAVNGSAAAISLFVPVEPDMVAMITELMLWYENTALPIFQPQGQWNYNDVKDEEMVTSISKSTLCHVSNTKWCKEALSPINSPLRKERCGRVSADCAAKTVEIMNRYYDDPKCTFATLAKEEKECLSCHGANGSVENVSNKMNCVQCHDDLDPNHATKVR